MLIRSFIIALSLITVSSIVHAATVTSRIYAYYDLAKTRVATVTETVMDYTIPGANTVTITTYLNETHKTIDGLSCGRVSKVATSHCDGHIIVYTGYDTYTYYTAAGVIPEKIAVKAHYNMWGEIQSVLYSN